MSHRRILLLTNPKARKGAELVKKVRGLISDRGVEIVAVEDGGPAHFARAIREHAQWVDLVAVGGGDGSMNAALPTLMEVKLPLAVLPFGTSNNLARSIGVPLDIEGACNVLRNGVLKPIDLGWVNGHHFFNVAGIGLSNQVNKEVPGTSKRRWGMLAYAATAYRVLKKFRPFWGEIRSPAHSLCIRSMQISIVNSKHFGSGLVVANDAAIDDGELDLCSVEVKKLTELPRILATMKGGDYGDRQAMLHFRDTEFTVRTRHPMPVDTDGEITTMTPAHFKCIPKAFQVLCPPPVPMATGAEEPPPGLTVSREGVQPLSGSGAKPR